MCEGIWTVGDALVVIMPRISPKRPYIVMTMKVRQYSKKSPILR